jgi:hypothetical protein
MVNQTALLENLTNWYTKQGYRVIITPSSGWVELVRGVFQAFPYHWIVTPSDEELKFLFKHHFVIAIRYSAPVRSSQGQISYHIVYDRKDYPLSPLPSNTKKGLKYATFAPISLKVMAEEGWILRNDTLVRQGREHAESKEFWQRLCLSAEGIPGFEAWAAIHQGELAATILTYTLGDTVSILYQQSKTECMVLGVNNALTYAFTHEVLQRKGIQCIFYGLHSLDAPASVDKYKLSMKYRAKPLRQKVIFNPIIQPLVNQMSYKLILQVKNWLPSVCVLNKVEGMMRFYLYGNYPLIEQSWPEILMDKKEEFLAPTLEKYMKFFLY